MAEYPIFDDSSLSFGIRAERTGLDIQVIPQGPDAYYFEFPGPPIILKADKHLSALVLLTLRHPY